jgi:hypothetical protein
MIIASNQLINIREEITDAFLAPSPSRAARRRACVLPLVGGPSDDSNGTAWVFAEPVVFAGTPGKANCHGKSVSALAQQFGGLNGAAAALGYASVQALQYTIEAFCGR